VASTATCIVSGRQVDRDTAVRLANRSLTYDSRNLRCSRECGLRGALRAPGFGFGTSLRARNVALNGYSPSLNGYIEVEAVDGTAPLRTERRGANPWDPPRKPWSVV